MIIIKDRMLTKAKEVEKLKKWRKILKIKYYFCWNFKRIQMAKI